MGHTSLKRVALCGFSLALVAGMKVEAADENMQSAKQVLTASQNLSAHADTLRGVVEAFLTDVAAA
jgi:hypothetical protein